ncbi:MAG: hypothetical protein D6767_10645 [Candidatus Hydrogenedentota bacterium]|nr:MAG: hypothetical protein D6767_10645 [Candidatus Hydrogenedentota bacterium]
MGFLWSLFPLKKWDKMIVSLFQVGGSLFALLLWIINFMFPSRITKAASAEFTWQFYVLLLSLLGLVFSTLWNLITLQRKKDNLLS